MDPGTAASFNFSELTNDELINLLCDKTMELIQAMNENKDAVRIKNLRQQVQQIQNAVNTPREKIEPAVAIREEPEIQKTYKE